MNFKFINEEDENYFIKSNGYYSMQSLNKFIKYFFPDNLNVKFNENSNDNTYTNYNTVLCGIQLDNNIYLDEKKFNILICVENCNVHKHYKHYNKYINFNDEKIKLYFYNHIDKCIITDKYFAVPVIYTQINYLINNYSKIMPSINTSYNDKKFCLFASNNKYNECSKNIIKQYLNNIGECDTINMYKNEIYNKSCYHSEELLNVFNKYKFIFVSENSFTDGYITEKIFNCIFARCIPIYLGSTKIEYYFNKDSIINVNDIVNDTGNSIDNKICIDNIIKKIKDLNSDENKFNEMIDTNKINILYDDENYKENLKLFVDKNINYKENKLY